MEFLMTKHEKINPFRIYLMFFAISIIFTAGCNDDREPTAPVEINRPQYLGVDPADGQLVVPVTKQIKIRFTKQMNPATFTTHFTVKDIKGNPVDGAFSIQDSIVVFTPAKPLEKSTIYFTGLKGRLRDYHNNSIEQNGDPILNDTTSIYKGWFYTEGDYSSGGYYNAYIRDRKEGTISVFESIENIAKFKDTLSAPQGMAVTEDGNYIIASNSSNNQVVFINAKTKSIEKSIVVNASPANITINGDYAYVISPDSKTFTKIKISSKSIEKAFTLTFFPAKIAVSNDGAILYTFDQQKRDLYLLNTSDGKVIKKITAPVDKIVTGEIRVDKADVVYLCDSKGLKVKKMDKNGTTITTLFTYSGVTEPVDLAFNCKYLLVAAGKYVFKYDVSSNAPIDTLKFTTNAKSLAINTSNDLLYVVNATAVSVFDITTSLILKELEMNSSGIESVLVNPIKF